VKPWGRSFPKVFLHINTWPPPPERGLSILTLDPIDNLLSSCPRQKRDSLEVGYPLADHPLCNIEHLTLLKSPRRPIFFFKMGGLGLDSPFIDGKVESIRFKAASGTSREFGRTLPTARCPICVPCQRANEAFGRFPSGIHFFTNFTKVS
jgi:hypothetical protein